MAAYGIGPYGYGVYGVGADQADTKNYQASQSAPAGNPNDHHRSSHSGLFVRLPQPVRSLP